MRVAFPRDPMSRGGVMLGLPERAAFRVGSIVIMNTNQAKKNL